MSLSNLDITLYMHNRLSDILFPLLLVLQMLFPSIFTFSPFPAHQFACNGYIQILVWSCLNLFPKLRQWQQQHWGVSTGQCLQLPGLKIALSSGCQMVSTYFSLPYKIICVSSLHCKTNVFMFLTR